MPSPALVVTVATTTSAAATRDFIDWRLGNRRRPSALVVVAGASLIRPPERSCPGEIDGTRVVGQEIVDRFLWQQLLGCQRHDLLGVAFGLLLPFVSRTRPQLF